MIVLFAQYSLHFLNQRIRQAHQLGHLGKMRLDLLLAAGIHPGLKCAFGLFAAIHKENSPFPGFRIHDFPLLHYKLSNPLRCVNRYIPSPECCFKVC